MTRKAEQKPKLTDAERHKRFVEMARKTEASDNPKDFEKAFKKITSPRQGEGQRARRSRS